MNIKRLLFTLLITTATLCAKTTNALAYIADDFCGANKFCTQTFHASEMFGTDLIQESTCSTFEKIDDTHIRIKSFKNGGSVTFTIDGDKLYLDKTEQGNGLKTASKAQEIKIEGKTAKIECATHHTKTKDGKDYHYFKLSKSKYYGIISKTETGISVVFEPGVYLQLRTRLTAGDATSTTWFDWSHSYKKIVFEIFESNGTVNSTPIYAIESNNGNFQKVDLYNLFSTGSIFGNISENASQLNKCATIEFNNNNQTFLLKKQNYIGYLNPAYDKNNIINDGTYNYYVKSNNPSNMVVEGVDGDDITGKYDAAYNVINTGWHKKHGGELEILKNVSMSLNWCTYKQPLGGEAGTKTIYKDNILNYTVDATPEVEAPNVDYTYVITYGGGGTEEGIRVKGNIPGAIKTGVIESYQILAYRGEPMMINENSFPVDEELGHSQAVVLADVEPSNGTLTFDKYTKIADMPELWQDLSPNDKLTFFVRMKLKDASDPQSAKEREASSPRYAFAGMSDRSISPTSLLTGIDEITENNVRISSGDGMIDISNAVNPVEVFNIDGKKIYFGEDTTIRVNPGLYIVKSGNTTRKILVK